MLRRRLNCSDSGIYVATCTLCQEQYVGQTITSFATRWNAHRKVFFWKGRDLLPPRGHPPDVVEHRRREVNNNCVLFMWNSLIYLFLFLFIYYFFYFYFFYYYYYDIINRRSYNQCQLGKVFLNIHFAYVFNKKASSFQSIAIVLSNDSASVFL